MEALILFALNHMVGTETSAKMNMVAIRLGQANLNKSGSQMESEISETHTKKTYDCHIPDIQWPKTSKRL